MIKKMSKEKIIITFLLFIVASFYNLFYSIATSPLYYNVATYDADVFKFIGRAWSYGYLPYVTIFDHKGPLIYFLNMIGYIIGGDKAYGIMILQIIFMTITLLGLYYISRLCVKNKIISFLIVVFSLLSWGFIGYTQGNKTEEWCLPFLTWTFYYVIKYLIYDNKKINLKSFLLYGITTGVCINIKFTNMISVIILIGFVFLHLLINKKIKEFIIGLLLFIFGNLIITLPFIIYFYTNNSLNEMIYDAFLFQFEYGNEIKNLTIDFLFIIKYCYPVYLFIPTMFLIRKKVDNFAFFALLSNAILVIIILSIIRYKQYYMVITIPYLAFCLGEIYNYICEIMNKKILIKILNILVYVGMITLIIFKVKAFRSLYNMVDTKAEEVLERIDKNEKEYLMPYLFEQGDANYFLIKQNIIKPYYKYYFNQDWFSSMSEKIKTDILKTYEFGDAKYIITNTNDDNILIKEILDKRYEKTYSNEKYNLYNLKKSIDTINNQDNMNNLGDNNIEENTKNDNIIIGYNLSDEGLKINKANRKILSSLEKDKEGNIVFSNAGIQSVLKMASLAASGNTKTQIDNVNGDFSKNLNSEAVNIYNFMTINENINNAKVKNEYIDTLKSIDYIKSDVYEINNENNPKDVAKSVNEKIDKETNGQIKDGVDPSTYENENFIMQLGNVIHFLGTWEHADNEHPYDLKTMHYKNKNNEKVKTDFVKINQNDARLIENDDIIGFSLNYREDDMRYSYVSFLPKDENNFDIEKIDVDNLNFYDETLYDLNVKFPKFEFDNDTNLTSIIEALGISDLFDVKNADLTNAFNFDKNLLNVYASAINQKSVIRVDEIGTEASALTTMDFMVTTSYREERLVKVRKVDLTFNRPFYFMIFDNEKNIPIFIGEINTLTDNGKNLDDENEITIIDTIVEELRN